MEVKEPLATIAPEIIGGDIPPPTEINEIPVTLLNKTITVGSDEDLVVQAAQGPSKKKEAPVVLPNSLTVVDKPVKAAVKKQSVKVDKPPKIPKVQDRTGYTIHFYGEEQQYIKNIFDARKEAGISVDFSQFLRQAIDFAINFNSQLPQLEKKVQFSVPEQKTILLKNGFFDQE